MLQQFPLPDEERLTSEKQAIEMGQTALEFLEESYSLPHSLRINQRAILAEFCLATIDGKITLTEKIQTDLAIKERKATELISSLRRSISRKTNKRPALQTKVTQCPGNKRKNGYYLQIVPSADTTASETDVSILEIKKRIKGIRESLLRQMQPADEERGAMPLIDEERQKILATIEEVRQEVEQALAMTPHGLRGESRTLIKILLEGSERGEAIIIPKEKLPDLHGFEASLKRSHQINLKVKSQQDHRNEKIFGYYLGQKDAQELQKNHKKPTLPASANPLTEDQGQMLTQLIKRAIQQTSHQARRKLIILQALQMASAAGKQVTPAYCQYVEHQLSKKTCPTRNFEDRLLRMPEIPEAQFGFRVERTGPKTWQAVPSTDQEILRPILAEIAKQKEEEEKRDPEELKKRVQTGLKHLNAQYETSLQAVFDILIQAYADKQVLSVEEITKRSKIKSVVDQIERWFRRVEAINRDLPDLLGFNVKEEGTERYRLELTEHYVPTEIPFSGHSATHPVPVEEGTNFNRAAFNKILKSPKKQKSIKRMAQRTRVALDILASHSEKGQAISKHYLENATTKAYKPRSRGGRGLISTIHNLLKRIKDGKITLNSHKLRTWYLSVDESATGKPKATPPTPTKKEQEKAKEAEAAAAAETARKQAEAEAAAEAARQQSVATLRQKMEAAQKRAASGQPGTLRSGPKLPEIEEEFGAVTEEIPNPVAIRKGHNKDDKDEYSHLPQTSLMKFQNEIIATARAYTSGVVTLESLQNLKTAIRELDTKKQPLLIKTQQAYLEKLNSAIKRAEREIATALSQLPKTEDEAEKKKMEQAAQIVPEYLTTQLYSV